MHIKTGVLFPRITIFQPTLVPVCLQQSKSLWVESQNAFREAIYNSRIQPWLLCVLHCIHILNIKCWTFNFPLGDTQPSRLSFSPLHKLPHVIKVILIPPSFSFPGLPSGFEQHLDTAGKEVESPRAPVRPCQSKWTPQQQQPGSGSHLGYSTGAEGQGGAERHRGRWRGKCQLCLFAACTWTQ